MGVKWTSEESRQLASGIVNALAKEFTIPLYTCIFCKYTHYRGVSNMVSNGHVTRHPFGPYCPNLVFNQVVTPMYVDVLFV